MTNEEMLKRIAELEAKVLKLENKIVDLEDELSKKTMEALDFRLKWEEELKKHLLAEEKVQIQKQELFGASSEKESAILNEAEVSTSIKEPKPISKRGRKNGLTLKERFLRSKNVEYEKEVIKGPEYCPECGEKLIKISENHQLKVVYVPGKFVVKEYVYEQMKCPNDEKIFSSETNNSFPGTMLTAEFASEILVNKYMLGIPLYRMEQYWNSQGIPITRQALADYCIKCAFELYPLYDRLKDYLINCEHKIMHADETTIQVLDINAGSNAKRTKSYIWVYATSMIDKPIMIYDFEEDRKSIRPKEFLKEYKGKLVVDGYDGYNSVENVTLCGCWSHARRHFTDLLTVIPDEQKPKSLCYKFVILIDEMFRIEREIFKKTKTMDELLEKRKIEIQPIFDEYFKLAEESLDKSDGKLRTAIKYSLDQRDKLSQFLVDSGIPMTNNLAERAVKPFVMCRKNFLFAKSISGAESAAVLFSIIQTAKANGLIVEKYLTHLFNNMLDDKLSNIDSYLPWNEEISKKFGIKK